MSRANGEPLHRAKAAMLVADCASEALTTEDELRRERSRVQCEAQASLSALRRELPPALHLHLLELWLLLQLNSLLRNSLTSLTRNFDISLCKEMVCIPSSLAGHLLGICSTNSMGG